MLHIYILYTFLFFSIYFNKHSLWPSYLWAIKINECKYITSNSNQNNIFNKKHKIKRSAKQAQQCKETKRKNNENFEQNKCEWYMHRIKIDEQQLGKARTSNVIEAVDWAIYVISFHVQAFFSHSLLLIFSCI